LVVGKCQKATGKPGYIQVSEACLHVSRISFVVGLELNHCFVSSSSSSSSSSCCPHQFQECKPSGSWSVASFIDNACTVQINIQSGTSGQCFEGVPGSGRVDCFSTSTDISTSTGANAGTASPPLRNLALPNSGTISGWTSASCQGSSEIQVGFVTERCQKAVGESGYFQVSAKHCSASRLDTAFGRMCIAEPPVVISFCFLAISGPGVRLVRQMVRHFFQRQLLHRRSSRPARGNVRAMLHGKAWKRTHRLQHSEGDSVCVLEYLCTTGRDIDVGTVDPPGCCIRSSSRS
jgi:hypothetical protein